MEELGAHIESIDTRGDREDERLATALLLRAWPGGSADRIEPSAVEWLRRWGPAHMGGDALRCSCATGRCTVCN